MQDYFFKALLQSQAFNWDVCVLVAQWCPTLCDPMVCPWNSPGKNTGVGCHSLLQGIFATQGLNPGLLHCGQILYHLSNQGSPWAVYAYSFSLCILFFFFPAWNLCYCMQTFSNCGEQGLLLVAVCGLLIALAFLVAEHGVLVCRFQ